MTLTADGPLNPNNKTNEALYSNIPVLGSILYQIWHTFPNPSKYIPKGFRVINLKPFLCFMLADDSAGRALLRGEVDKYPLSSNMRRYHAAL